MTSAPTCATCEAHVDDVLFRLKAGKDVSAARWLWAPAAGPGTHVLVGHASLVIHPAHCGHADPQVPDAVVVRARPTALPLPSRSVAALVLPPVLPRLADLDGVFAELRRVLRPHGLLTMAVPHGPPLGLRGRRLRADVRSHWTHRSAVDHPDWLLTAADFAVMGDDRVEFRDRGADGAAGAAERVAEQCAAGLLPPTLPPELRERLAAHRAVGAGRTVLRRLVARR